MIFFHKSHSQNELDAYSSALTFFSHYNSLETPSFLILDANVDRFTPAN